MAQAAVAAMKARVILHAKRNRPIATNMETHERRYSLKRSRDHNSALLPPAKRPKLYNWLFGLSTRQLEQVRQRITQRKLRWYTEQLDRGCPPPYSLRTFLFGAQKPRTPDNTGHIVPHHTPNGIVWMRDGKVITNTEKISLGRDVQIAEYEDVDSSQKGVYDTMFPEPEKVVLTSYSYEDIISQRKTHDTVIPDFLRAHNDQTADHDSVQVDTSSRKRAHDAFPDYVYGCDVQTTDSINVDTDNHRRAHDTVFSDYVYGRDVQTTDHDSVHVATSIQKRTHDILLPDYVQTTNFVHIDTSSRKKAHDPEVPDYARDVQTNDIATSSQKKAHDIVLPDYDENEYPAPCTKRQRSLEEADTAPMKKRVLPKECNARCIQVQYKYKNSNLASVSSSAVTPWVPPETADTPLSCSITMQQKTIHTETGASTTASAIKSILKKQRAEFVSDSDAKTDVPACVGQKRVRFLLESERDKDSDEFSSPSAKRQRFTCSTQEDRGKAARSIKRKTLLKKWNGSSSHTARRSHILPKRSNITGISNVAARPRDQLEPTDDTPVAHWVTAQLNKLCAAAHVPIPCSKTVLERAKGRKSCRKTQGRSNSQSELDSDSEGYGADTESDAESDLEETDSGSDSEESDTGLDTESDSEESDTGIDTESDSEESDSGSDAKSESKESDSESGTDSSGVSSAVVKDHPVINLQQKQVTVSTPSSQANASPKSDNSKTAFTVSEPKNLHEKPCISIEKLISLLLSKLSFTSATATVKPAKLVGLDRNPFKLHLKRHHGLKHTFVSHRCVRLLKSQVATLTSGQQ